MDVLYNSKSDFVKITIDSSQDILVDETSRIAKSIKNDADIISMFPNGCSIEVGTPGIGSNLSEKFQYEKNIGRKLSVEYHKGDNNVFKDLFQLIDVRQDAIKVKKNKDECFILFKNIVSAKIKVSFD